MHWKWWKFDDFGLNSNQSNYNIFLVLNLFLCSLNDFCIFCTIGFGPETSISGEFLPSGHRKSKNLNIDGYRKCLANKELIATANSTKVFYPLFHQNRIFISIKGFQFFMRLNTRYSATTNQMTYFTMSYILVPGCLKMPNV